jgi:CheY-like chemotaxis protein
LHDGKIGVYSEGDNKGTTFVVDIPITSRTTKPTSSRVKRCPFASNTTRMSATFDSKKFQAFRLLLVDDSAMNRKIVKRVLEGKFNLIDEAENGAEAVKMIRTASDDKLPYHLVVMDSHMPVMNGLDATKVIKSIGKKFPFVIGLTGNAAKTDIDSFLNAGADKVMVKPLNLDEFYTFICEILSGSAAE